MPRRTLRLAGWLLLGLLLLTALAAGAAAALLGTQAGTAWLLREAAPRAGVAVDFQALSGSLLGRLEVSGLRVAAADIEADVGRLVLHWRPTALLSRRLHLAELRAESVDLRMPPADPDPSEPRIAVPELPEVTLPVAVQVDRLALEGLRLDGQPALDRLSLALSGEDASLAVRELSLARERLALAGSVTLRLRDDWPLDGALTLSGEQDGTPLDLDLALTGSARAPQATLEARAPLRASARLEGDLRQHPPRAELTADWEDAALPAAGKGGAPLASPSGALRASTDALSLRVHLDAALRNAPGEIRRVALDLTGQLDTLSAPFPFTAELDWQVQSAAAAFSGGGTLAGDTKRLDLDHVLESPFRVTTLASVWPAGPETRATLAGDWRDLAWPPGASAAPSSPSGRYHLAGNLRDLQASVEAVLAGAGGASALSLDLSGGADPQPPHAFRAALAWHLDTEQAGRVQGEGSAQGDRERVAFQHRVSGPGRVEASGSVQLVPRLELDVRGELAELRWPLAGDPTARVLDGSFSVSGEPRALRSRLQADAEAAPVGPLALRAAGLVTPQEVRELDVSLELLDGRVNARGRVAFADALQATLEVVAEKLNPAALHPQAAGSVGARLEVDLHTGGRVPQGFVTLHELSGQLGGHPVAGSGRVELTDSGVRTERVALRSGENTVTLSGAVADTLSLDYRIDAPALGQLWPGLRGSVRGQGRVRGAPAAPQLRASLDARGVVVGATSLDSASLEAHVDLSRQSDSTVRLRAAGLVAGATAVASASLDLDGTPGQHRLRVRAEASEGALAADARGALGEDNASWAGELTALSARRTALGDWALAQPVALRADAGGVESGDACLRSGEASLCVRAGRPARGVQAVDADLATLPVARFARWLPPGLAISGALNAEARARMSGEGLEASATVSATPTRLSLSEETAGAPLELTLDDTRLEARHDARGTSASLSSRLAGDGKLEGQLSLGGTAGGAPLSGKLEAQLPDLSPFQALVPDLAGLGGRLGAELALAGTLAHPTLAGSARLDEGRASVPAAGITLERTRLTLRGDEQGRVTLDGAVHSGPGRIQLSGEGRIADGGYSARLQASGERFEAVKLLPVQALISPDLRLEASPEQIAVNGKVHVPRASVTIDEVPPDVVQVSDDETIVGREPSPTSDWREKLRVKVDVTLGDEVQVSAFGLDTDLEGGLTLAVDGKAPPTARGTVTLRDGRFTAYGQDLEVRRGRLLFAGPLDNPGLDFRAVRDAGEVVAGIEVSGTAERMRSQIFSEPSLPQAEALSWLLTGHGLAGASSSEGQQLASAAIALGLDQSEQVTRRIGSALGLDELAVNPGDSLDESSLVLGKSLSPRLYIRYALGVLDREGSVQLDYKLTDRISLEAESGSSHGADVLYRLER